MDRLQRMYGFPGAGGAQAIFDQPVPDTAEITYISSLSLLKMLKHGNLSLLSASDAWNCLHIWFSAL